MVTMKALAKLLIVLLFSSICSFGQTTVKPDVITDTSFVDFRNKLSVALKNKNVDDFLLLVSDTIATDLCGMHSAKKCLYNHLKYDTGYARSWMDRMLFVVEQGFVVFSEKDKFLIEERIIGRKDIVYEAPYYFRNVTNIYDLFLTENNQKIYAMPTYASKVITSLSKTVVKSNIRNDSNDSMGNRWCKIVMKNGKVGYVPYNDTSQEVDCQLLVRKIKGEWRVVYYESRPKC